MEETNFGSVIAICLTTLAAVAVVSLVSMGAFMHYQNQETKRVAFKTGLVEKVDNGVTYKIKILARAE